MLIFSTSSHPIRIVPFLLLSALLLSLFPVPPSARASSHPVQAPIAITSITPAQGPVGTQVMLAGHGFTPTANRINFAGVNNVMINLSSPDGATLAFAIPATPCDQIKKDICIAKVIDPGTYLISVENANGISNTLAFTVILPPSSQIFTQRLTFGSRSAAVSQLQQSLKSDPSLYPEGLVTGYFGPLTEQAVKRFQVKYGIVSSGDANTTGYGLVGPRTNTKLKEMFGKSPALFPSTPASAESFIKALTKEALPAPDCATITDPFSKSSCIQQKAIQDKDISLCNQITSSYLFISRDTCVSGVAQAKKDASLCASIVNPDIKKSCEDTIKNPPPSFSPPFSSLENAKFQTAALTAAVSRLLAQAGGSQSSPTPPPAPPTASSLLSSLAIDPKEYTLGQTLTGNLVLQNKGQSPVTASFRSELTRDNILVWSKDYDNVLVAVGTTHISLDTIFGFVPTIPNDPAYIGNWVLTVKRKDAGTSERVSATFTIKAPPVITPLTLSLTIEPKEYELGQVLQGKGSVTNPNPTPVSASFKAELFQEGVLKWQKHIPSVSIPSGTTNFTLADLFGAEPRVPDDESYVGSWKMVLTQTYLREPGTRVEASFTIVPVKGGLTNYLKHGGKSLLFVGAHPGDEILVGSLLAQGCKEYRNKCSILTLTASEKGCRPGGLCGEELRYLNRSEQTQFAKHIGAESFIRNYPDASDGIFGSPLKVKVNWDASLNDPAWYTPYDVKGELLYLIRKVNPDVVITLEPTNGVYGHADKKTVGTLVTETLEENDDLTHNLYYALNRYRSLSWPGPLDPLPVTDVVPGTIYSSLLGTTYWDYFMDAARARHQFSGYRDVYDRFSLTAEEEKVSWFRKVTLERRTLPGDLLGEIQKGKSIMWIAPHKDDEIAIGALFSFACKERGNQCTIVGLEQASSPEHEEKFRSFAVSMNATVVSRNYPIGGGPGKDTSAEEVIALWNKTNDIKQDIISIIREKNPDIIITLEPSRGAYGHADHKAAGILTTQVWSENNLSSRLYYAIVRNTSWYNGNADAPPWSEVFDGRVYSPKLGMSYWQYFLESGEVYRAYTPFIWNTFPNEQKNWFRPVTRADAVKITPEWIRDADLAWERKIFPWGKGSPLLVITPPVVYTGSDCGGETVHTNFISHAKPNTPIFATNWRNGVMSANRLLIGTTDQNGNFVYGPFSNKGEEPVFWSAYIEVGGTRSSIATLEVKECPQAASQGAQAVTPPF